MRPIATRNEPGAVVLASWPSGRAAGRVQAHLLHRLLYAPGTWPFSGTGRQTPLILGHPNTEAASKVTGKGGENSQRPDRPGRGLGLRPSVPPRGNLGGPFTGAALKTSCVQKCQGSLSTGSPAGYLNIGASTTPSSTIARCMVAQCTVRPMNSPGMGIAG